MQLFFYILIRSRKSYEYLDKCIDSLLSQKYKYFKILFVDDNSKYTKKQISHLKEKLHGHIAIFNKTRKYSIRNAYELLHKYAQRNDAVVFNLDGDDWLPHPNCLSTVASVYSKNPKCLLTWGECSLYNRDTISKRPSRFLIPNTNISYSKKVIKDKLYRKHPFLPLHPRTWKVSIFKKIPKSEFLDTYDSWLKFAEDQAIFYPMLEAANGNFKVIKKPIYVYNKSNPHADSIENTFAQLSDELQIRKKHSKTSIYEDLSDRKIICLYHNSLLFIPILGDLLYKLQIFLTRKIMISKIYISRHDNVLRTKLLLSLNSNVVIICKTYKFGKILRDIKPALVFDNPEIKLHKLTANDLKDLLWTLVYSSFMTKETKVAIKDFVPPDFPVFNY